MDPKDYEWRALSTLLPEGWEQSAFELGAFERTREIKSPAQLLRAILALAASEGGARTAAVELKAAGVVEISAEGLRKRLEGADAWLAWIARHLCQAFRDSSLNVAAGLRPRAIDSTTIQSPSASGTDFRLHYSIDLLTLACDWHELTDHRGAELLERVPVAAGDVIIGDRNFLRAAGVQAVTKAGARVVVRLRSNHDRMLSEDGSDFRALTHAQTVNVGDVGEWSVRLVAKDGSLIAGRVIILKLPAPIAAKATRRLERKASRKQRKPGMDARIAANYVMIFTTVPRELLAAKAVLDLYRFRWQIEIAFKRLKQILRLGHLPHKTPTKARSWILAKLVLALLLEKILRQGRTFSPWAFDISRVSA